jgi:hypothetical protein
MSSAASRCAWILLVLASSTAACRNDGQAGAGTVPAEAEVEAPEQANDDVVDPGFTVDTQRIPGTDTP